MSMREKAARKALLDLRKKIKLLEEFVNEYSDLELSDGLIWPEINSVEHVNEIVHNALVFIDKEEA